MGSAFLAPVVWRSTTGIGGSRSLAQRCQSKQRRAASASVVRACVQIPGVDMASRAAALAARDAAEEDEEEVEVDLRTVHKDIPMLNLLVLTGRLGADPVLRQVGRNGTSLCTFSLAVSSNRTGKDGMKHTSWFRINIWGTRGERAAEMLRKGMRVGVHGGVGVDEFTDKAGNKRTSVCLTAKSFEILQSKGEFGADAGAAGTSSQSYSSSRMRSRPGGFQASEPAAMSGNGVADGSADPF